MDDDRFDGGVEMGRLNNPPHKDNTLRIYHTGQSKITIQLRGHGWYLCRAMTDTEVLELIQVLAGKLLAKSKADEEASEFSGLTAVDEAC